jgi:hypothetical protein
MPPPAITDHGNRYAGRPNGRDELTLPDSQGGVPLGIHTMLGRSTSRHAVGLKTTSEHAVSA